MLYRKDWLPLFDMNYSPLISISCIVLHVQCPDYKKTRELFSSFLHKLNSAPLLGNCCTSDIERTGFFFYTWFKLLSIFFLATIVLCFHFCFKKMNREELFRFPYKNRSLLHYWEPFFSIRFLRLYRKDCVVL